MSNNHPWLDEAYKDEGLKEIPGSKHNPKVLAMYEEAGHGWVDNDEVAWCAAAVNAWLKRAGYIGTMSLAARSFLKWGKSLNKEPRRGAIAVFNRGTKSWQGHVAICTGRTKRGYIEVIGGNQNNAVNVKWYPTSRLLDTRWPSTVSNSRSIKAAMVSGASGTFGLVAETAQEVLPITQEAAQWSQYAQYAAFALTVLAAVAMFIYRIQDMREKGR